MSNLDSSDASNGSDSQGGSSSADVSGSSSDQSASSKPKPLDPTKVDMKGRTIRLHIGQVEAESTSQVGVKFSQKSKRSINAIIATYNTIFRMTLMQLMRLSHQESPLSIFDGSTALSSS